jgi:hypothetical protein
MKLDFRNNFIDIENITGVDLKNATIVPDTRFTNCKTVLREEVMDSLMQCDNPKLLDPIKIFQDDKGEIHIVDGFHRLQRALIGQQTDEVWKRIPYTMFRGTVEDAQFEAVRCNLEDSRGYLTPAEEMSVIMKWIDQGYEPEQILKKLGRSPENVRWVNKINDIRTKGIYAVESAVAESKIDITTAAKIARKNPSEQKAALEAAIVAVEEGKSLVEVRDAAGVKKTRKKMLSYAETLEYLFTFYDDTVASAYESGAIDDNLMGQITAIMVILGLEDMKMMDRFEVLDDLYLKHEEANKPKPVVTTRKVKRETKAPWQV